MLSIVKFNMKIYIFYTENIKYLSFVRWDGENLGIGTAGAGKGAEQSCRAGTCGRHQRTEGKQQDRTSLHGVSALRRGCTRRKTCPPQSGGRPSAMCPGSRALRGMRTAGAYRADQQYECEIRI